MSIIFKDIIIELFASRIHGVGVFAVQKINEGDFVAEGVCEEDYKDLVLWDEVKDASPLIKRKISDFCIGTPEGFIPPEDHDFSKLTVEWYFNHSCEGNVGFDENGDFVSIRDIPEGEELTYDYGLAESNPLFLMQCRCKSTSCRHTITGNDWKDPEFRRTNLQHMLPRLRMAFK
ncbi:MAG TPA: SET domain-containing protein-lysine N-methyltransferase [Syntrophales bacterium]|nr:SET domain-containing protein-lysine N-methyltransferase [Syntrophales bacterium]